MGGMTALALAGEHPELFRDRVAGIALLATGAGHYVDGHPIENLFRWLSRRHLLAVNLLAFQLVAPLLELFRPRRTRTMRRGSHTAAGSWSTAEAATFVAVHGRCRLTSRS